LSAAGQAKVAPEWLALREAADAAARSVDLLAPLRARLASAERLVIRDVGCGTGSMARWLAGRLHGPQHWILHDLDSDLLAHASATGPAEAGDGTAVTRETRQGDLVDLDPADLAGTSLVTASALLDLLTLDEVDGLADACVAAGCPTLLTLTVVGAVELTPTEPLDAEFGAAFNAHQRRRVGHRQLLGPDAVTAAAEAFRRRGAVVRTARSPWRLDSNRTALVEEWLRGWVEAGCVDRPDLASHADGYLRRRLDACGTGDLRAVVHHADLLALPVPR
jgi:hypothetical protein